MKAIFNEKQLIDLINNYDTSSNATNSIILENLIVQCPIDMGMWFPSPNDVKLKSDIGTFENGRKIITAPLVFINVHFQKSVYVTHINFTENMVFDSCNFIQEASFSRNEFTSISFKNCGFGYLLDFTGNTIIKQFSLNSCRYKKIESQNNTYKQECIVFYGDHLNSIEFNNSVFECPVDFKVTTISNCDFKAVEFHQKADFKEAKFYGDKNNFNYAEFKNLGAFWGCTFEQVPSFDHLILGNESHVFFTHLQGTIPLFSLTNTVINGRVDFEDDAIKKLDLKGSVVVGTLSRVNFDPECANYQTATLLKDEELKRNNIIKALEYQAIEKDKYMEWLRYKTLYTKLNHVVSCGELYNQFIKSKVELKWRAKFFLSIIYQTWNSQQKEKCKLLHKKEKLQKQFNYVDIPLPQLDKTIWQLRGERFSLWLSKYFHNHGQDWVRALRWTLGIWIVSFIFFKVHIYDLFSLTTYNGEFFADLFSYLDITNYELLQEYLNPKDTPSYQEPLWWRLGGAFFYMFGKIFVPYGIFEIVRAFRKLK